MNRKLFKNIMLIILIIITIMLSSCGNKPQTQQIIHGAYGENFEIYLYDRKSNKLTDDKVKCTVNVVLEKENDLTNKNCYSSGGNFLKYSYSVIVNGTLDTKYAGRRVNLCLNFIPEYQVNRWSDSIIVVSENGTFSFLYTFSSNAILTEWVPTCIFYE